MKAVLDTKPTSIYDDDISRHYQFPRRYLATIERCVGDWILLRRPRADGGDLAYFATARVQGIEPDPKSAGLSYALLDEYLPFDVPVHWLTNGRYAEEALRNMPQKQIGVYLRGRSVRALSDQDFANVAIAGLSTTLDPQNAIRLGLESDNIDPTTSTLLAAPPEEQGRRIVEMLINRKIREASFRGSVCEAYGDRCAVTGLKIVNGGGRAEVQAAHIWSVAEGGPDIVQNGIALSATIHWLFDRHLISLTDDYGLLVSHNKVPAELRPLFEGRMKRIHLPADHRLWPYSAYVARHREVFANG